MPSAGTYVSVTSVSLCSSYACKVGLSELSQFKGSVEDNPSAIISAIHCTTKVTVVVWVELALIVFSVMV